MPEGFATLLAPSPARCPRELVEAAIEALIALLDAMDGDADLEAVCEDEGGQCEDEGADDDREPDAPTTCASYTDDQRAFYVPGPFGEAFVFDTDTRLTRPACPSPSPPWTLAHGPSLLCGMV